MKDHESSSTLVVVAVLALAAGTALRVWLAVASSAIEPWSDMKTYVDLADGIHNGVSTTIVDRPLLYPLILARARDALSSDDRLVLYLAQSAVSLAAVCSVGFLAWTIFGRRVALSTLAFAAPQLTLAQYGSLFLTETSFALLFLLWIAAICYLHKDDTEPTVASISYVWIVSASGVIAGITCALRPAAIPFGLGSMLGLLMLRGRTRRLLAPALFLTVLIFSYFGVTNATGVLTGMVTPPVPTFGVNLLLGNSSDARADGGAMKDLPADVSIIQDSRVRDEIALHRGTLFMLDHPFRTLRLGVTRLLRLLGVNPGRVEHDSLVRDGLPSWLTVLWLAGEWWTLLLLVGVSLVLFPVARRRMLLLAVVVAPYVFALSVTFVQTRFRLPLHLVLIPFAGATLSALLGGRIGTKRADAVPLAQLLLSRPVKVSLLLIIAGVATDITLHANR